MLHTTDLLFSYPGSAAIHFPKLSIAPGDHSLLLGASGSGKTTWLHLLGGLRLPTEGSIHFGDTEITSLSASRRDQFRGRSIGLVFQQPHLIHALSVMENLRLASQMADLPWRSSEAMGLLEELGIGHKASSRV
ncbi:MAG: ATP-binding cassette domain-containing protein, partial [Bacteroidota bacterium]